MKIGVVSDTHGYLDPRIEKIFAGVDHILHAGDIGDPIIELELKFVAPVTLVLGNTDDGLSFKLMECLTLGEKRFVLQHIVNPETDFGSSDKSWGRPKPDVVVFGHTHKKLARTIGGIFFFNPGYAGKPKYGTERSVAILHLEAGEIRSEFIPL